MKKNLITKTICTLALLVSASSQTYANPEIAAGLKLGTQGIGLDTRAPIADSFYARFGGNYFQYTHKVSQNSIDYKGKLQLFTVPLMLDYHPINNSGFKVSAGVAYNANKATLKASVNKNITLFGNTYTPAQLGTIKTTVKNSNSIAPLLTLGYDNSFITDSPVSFNFEVGAMYAGKLKVKTTATGLAGNLAQTHLDLKKNAEKALNNKNVLKFFPILSFGVRYSF